jgi:prolyl oligopeptidase
LNIPFTRRDDIIEDYHGTKVADPYRWLENPLTEETLTWVEANKHVVNKHAVFTLFIRLTPQQLA